MSGIPGPEPKRAARKNHEALGFPWNGRALLGGAAVEGIFFYLYSGLPLA